MKDLEIMNEVFYVGYVDWEVRMNKTLFQRSP